MSFQGVNGSIYVKKNNKKPQMITHGAYSSLHLTDLDRVPWRLFCVAAFFSLVT